MHLVFKIMVCEIPKLGCFANINPYTLATCTIFVSLDT